MARGMNQEQLKGCLRGATASLAEPLHSASLSLITPLGQRLLFLSVLPVYLLHSEQSLRIAAAPQSICCPAQQFPDTPDPAPKRSKVESQPLHNPATG